MELQGDFSSEAKLHRLKSDLKQWEREFQKQHGRVPSKKDIQASPSIHFLYREYARMKLKIPKENDCVTNASLNLKVRQPDGNENINTGFLGDGRGTSVHASVFLKLENSTRSSLKQNAELSGNSLEPVVHQPIFKSLVFPTTSSNSEDSEDGSYVLATPPKRTGSKLEQSTPISSYRPLRKPLQEISSGRCYEGIRPPTSSQPIRFEVSNVCMAINSCKRKRPGTDVPKKSTSTVCMNSWNRVLSTVENTLPLLPELSQEPGFVINRRRPGMLCDEQRVYREHDVLPAGFSASVLDSSLIRKECQKSTELVSGITTSEVDIRTPRESSTTNSCVLTTSLGPQVNEGGAGDTHRNINNCSQIGSVERHAAPKHEFPFCTQQLSSNLQREFELAENSNPLDTEGDAEVGCRDLDKELTGKSLQKLTVVALKQKLLKRGLPLIGNKSALISRLSAALSTEGGGDCSRADNLHGENCEQTEKATPESQFAEQRKEKATRGTGKGESDHDAEKGDLEPLNGSIASIVLRSGKLGSASSVVLRRSGTRSGRCAVRADDILPSFPDKIPHLSSDSLRACDVEVAGSIPTSKRVKRRSPQDIESPAIQRDASSKDSFPGCRDRFASDSPLENLNPLNSLPVASAGDVKDPSSKMRKKRIKLEKQPEESSWSKPKALQRRSQKKKTSSCRSSSLSNIHTQAVKPCGRNNFVKLNINGRGGGRRKFVTKSHFRKAGAYGRRGYRGRKSRRPGFEEADDTMDHDLLHADEVDDGGAVERKGSRSSRIKSTVIGMDTWVAGASHGSVPGCAEDSKSNLPPFVSDALARVILDPSNDNLLELLVQAFGFKDFRAGQVEAVKRILASQSTMVILPTGAGKSLCYQLPALVLPGVTLVISPLIALMTDQLHHLPPSLPGALVSSAQTYEQSSSIVARLQAGLIKVLFISPERLCSESFQRVLAEIPKINLAVIDEAHCLSEWSHNFRPSYFRLGSVLLEQMKVPCILAMTATATKRAERSIMEVLRVPSTGLVQAPHVRHNLVLTVSKEPNRLRSLLRMLQESPYSDARSVIIYCTFQVETDNISDFLQQSGIQAKSYHAKKSSQERSFILDHFCCNKLRVVVATVAFGMGLDKSDVRAVIHYNMPRSLEHYVQETGRAGRDGKPAFCHLFLDDNDYLKLRSLAHSEGVDEYAVGKVLSRIFHGKQESSKLGNPSSIIVETATKEFDMKEEVLETILSYLEVGSVEYVKSVSKLNATCVLSFHRSTPASLAETSILVAAVLKRSQEKQGRYVFNMVSLATHLQLSMFDMQFELRRLQVTGEITCEFGDPAFCFTVSSYPDDICVLTSAITKRLNDVEASKVRKVDAMYTSALALVCRENEEVIEKSTPSLISQQASFQATIKQYFDEDECPRPAQQLPSIIEPSRAFLRADIKDFVRSNKHANLTGRAVARIFYGIWSPAFPYSDWSRNHSWGKYEGVDFGVIKDIATAELIAQNYSRVRQTSGEVGIL